MVPHQGDRQVRWTALLVALLAIPVLWAGREVLPLDVLSRLLLPVLWLLAWTVACLGAGTAVWRLARGRGTPGGAPEVLAVGAAVLALVPAVLALTGLLRPWLLAALLATAAVTGVAALSRHARRLWESLPRPPRGLGLLLVLPVALIVAGLSAPPIFYDSLNYHLAFPALWLRAGGFVEVPRHFYSYYPAAVGMLYTYALALMGPWAARAMHLWLGVVAALAAGRLAERGGGPRAAGWAMVLFATTPAVLTAAGYPIADLGVAAWGGAALLLILDSEGWRQRPLGSGALLGLLLATAVDAKYLALATVALPAAAAFVVAARGAGRGEPLRLPRLAAGATAMAGFVLAPWLGRNLMWTGNPFYPYLHGLFGGQPTSTSILGEMGSGSAPPGSGAWLWHTLVALPVRTFAPLQVAGILGPLWLLLLPAALALPRARRRPAAALWAATTVGLLSWGALVQLGRYLLPVLVPMAALAGTAAALLTGPRMSRAVRLGLGVLLVGVVLWNASAVADAVAVQRLAVSVGSETEDAFLSHWVTYWPVVRHVNQDLPRGARVLLVGEPRSFYLERDVVVESPERTPLLVELARGSRDRSELAARLRALGVTHVLVDEEEMGRIAKMRGLPSYWSEADPHARAVIAALLSEGITERFGLPRLWVGRLAPDLPTAGSAGERPGDRGSSRGSG